VKLGAAISGSHVTESRRARRPASRAFRVTILGERERGRDSKSASQAARRDRGRYKNSRVSFFIDSERSRFVRMINARVHNNHVGLILSGITKFVTVREPRARATSLSRR